MAASSLRPLSPHLHVYRLPQTALLSISHRLTGVLLSVGLVWWVLYLLAASTGADSLRPWRMVLASPLGSVALWIWIYAWVFHLCHGLRHLLWDVGYGFERDRLQRHGIIQLIATLALTVGLWVLSWGNS